MNTPATLRDLHRGHKADAERRSREHPGHFQFAVACVQFSLFVLAMVVAPALLAAEATLSGTAIFRERMALPPQAVFEATLEDVSRAGAAAEVIARTRVNAPGNPPIRFALSYDPARIDPKRRYVVRAQIRVRGQLLFTTDTAYPVLGDGAQDPPELLMRRVGASAPPATASLENTYWKLMRLGTVAVVVGERQREPHLILRADRKQVGGSGGCNGLVGSYTLAGHKLSFGQMAGTLMACQQGMEQERAFHDALAKVAGWRIDGETLELLDAAGQSVASFESRYLR